METIALKKHRAHHRHIRGRYPDFDALADIEDQTGTELPGKSHALAEKPTKFLRRARSYNERYRPLHQR